MNAAMPAGKAVPAINGLCIKNDLPEAAFEILAKSMRVWGNRLSAEHAEGLRALLYAYTHTALGFSTKRQAWPMSVGAGKTVSIAAFAAAITSSCEDNISLMVAQNSIEALCKLKRLMIELGVPADRIGLFHSKRFSEEHAESCRNLDGPPGFASEPSIISDEKPERFQILLLSHARLKTRQEIYELNQYMGQERSLVIWDESLLKSSGRTMPIRSIKAAVGASQGLLEDVSNPEASHALAFLSYSLGEISGELSNQSEDKPARAIKLPEKTENELLAWEESLSSLLAGRAEDFTTLRQFLRLTQESLRAVQLNQGAIIKYDLLLPPKLKRIIVLDASYNIRELVKTYDRDLEEVCEYQAVKRFCNVQANQLCHSGGRSSIDPALRKKDSGLVKAIVKRVLSFPEDEGVILFTYKEKIGESRKGLKSHAAILKEALRAQGVDIGVTLPNGKPRFAWLTWGQELGLSSYAYCKHVMLIGIYRKSREVIATDIAGQMENLTAPEAGNAKIIREVELSEIFHALYQAMGRGSCRTTVDGQAEPMTLDWVGTEEFAEEYWQEATPGIQRGFWESRHVTSANLIKDSARAIKQYLENLDESVDYIRSGTLKSGAGLASQNRKTFQRAREAAGKLLVGWVYQKSRRGYIRCPFVR